MTPSQATHSIPADAKEAMVHLSKEAASGSHVAQWSMARRALRLALSRNGRPEDALTVAEVLGRMAASGGESTYIKDLGEILLARAGYERDRGNKAAADYYDADAWSQFNRLARDGDPDALATLATLPEPAFNVQNYDGIDDRLCAAANGDSAAMVSLYNHAATMLSQGECRLSEAMATREIMARLATFTSDGPDRVHLWRLVATMLDRDDFERNAGNLADAQAARSEALVTLSALADGGDVDAPEWIERLAPAPVDTSVRRAIIERPTIMRFINTSGEC